MSHAVKLHWIIADRVSREGTAIGRVRPPVCHLVFLMQLTFDLDVFGRLWVMTIAR